MFQRAMVGENQPSEISPALFECPWGMAPGTFKSAEIAVLAWRGAKQRGEQNREIPSAGAVAAHVPIAPGVRAGVCVLGHGWVSIEKRPGLKMLQKYENIQKKHSKIEKKIARKIRGA